MKKAPLLISACLLGTPCRYDGKSKPIAQVDSLKQRFDLIPICPETDGGLPTPRCACEIVGDRVIAKDGSDRTIPYQNGAKHALLVAKTAHCNVALLKEKSPSCGKNQIYDGSFTNTLRQGMGITAELLFQNNIKIFSEDELEALFQFMQKDPNQ